MPATGTYAIYDQYLPLEPTETRWIPQRELGRSGAGQQILSSVFSFEMKWGLMQKSEFNSLMQIYNSTSGSYVPCLLPDYQSSTYEFYGYTGCVVNKPTADKYFTQTVTGVTLLITRIDIALFRSI